MSSTKLSELLTEYQPLDLIIQASSPPFHSLFHSERISKVWLFEEDCEIDGSHIEVSRGSGEKKRELIFVLRQRRYVMRT